MADFNQHSQFGSTRTAQSTDAPRCARFEAMLADAVEGSLSPEDTAAFDQHLTECAACSTNFADAQRGYAWLEMLRPHRPEPATDLLDRIFRETSGPLSGPLSVQIRGEAGRETLRPGSSVDDLGSAETGTGALRLVSGAASQLAVSPPDTFTLGIPGDLSLPGNVLPFRQRLAMRFDPLRHTLSQPRLAMTAAMAFFSVAVTMSLTGVHVTELRASDLRPSSIRRSFYEANAHVVRYYDNLRVVYELESRVHDIERSAEVRNPDSPIATPDDGPGALKPDTQPAPDAHPGETPGRQTQPQNQPQNQPKPRSQPRPGSSERSPILPPRLVLAGLSLRGPARILVPELPRPELPPSPELVLPAPPQERHLA